MALDRAEVIKTVTKVYEAHGITDPERVELHADVLIAFWALVSDPASQPETALLVTSVAVDPADPDVQAYGAASAELVRKYLPPPPPE